MLIFSDIIFSDIQLADLYIWRIRPRVDFQNLRIYNQIPCNFLVKCTRIRWRSNSGREGGLYMPLEEVNFEVEVSSNSSELGLG